jgi:hypothetical protein
MFPSSRRPCAKIARRPVEPYACGPGVMHGLLSTMQAIAKGVRYQGLAQGVRHKTRPNAPALLPLARLSTSTTPPLRATRPSTLEAPWR